MQTSVKSVYDTLKHTDLFVIPPFQRAYSWTEEQVNALTNDLANFAQNTTDDPFFLGSILYLTNSQQHIELIDGQQRITTIFLLLKAFHDKFKMVLESSLAPSQELCDLTDKIHNIILRNGNVALETQVYLATDPYAGLFSTIMTAQYEVEDEYDQDNNYSQNYLCCSNWVNDYWSSHESKDVYRLVTLLLERTVLINLELDDLDSAIKIFDTLNTRGQDLSDSAIFKTILYANCKTMADKNDFIIAWTKLEENAQQTWGIEETFKSLMEIKLAQTPPKAQSETYSLRKFWLQNNYQHLVENDYKTLLGDLQLVLEFSQIPYLIDPEKKHEDFLKNNPIVNTDWFNDLETMKACYCLIFEDKWFQCLTCYWFEHHNTSDFAESFKLFAQRLATEFIVWQYNNNSEFDNYLDALMVEICKSQYPDMTNQESPTKVISTSKFKNELITRYYSNFQWYSLMIFALYSPEQNALPNYFNWPKMNYIVQEENDSQMWKDGSSKICIGNQIGNQTFLYRNTNETNQEKRAEMIQRSNISEANSKIRTPLAMNMYLFSDQGGYRDIYSEVKPCIEKRNNDICNKLRKILTSWYKAYEKDRQ